MNFLRRVIHRAALAVLMAGVVSVEAQSNNSPEFNEVFQLIKENLAGKTPADLDRAAVQGLVSQLQPRVSIVSGSENSKSQSDAPTLVKSVLFDGPIAYFRVGRVGPGLQDEIMKGYKELNGTNKLKGVVLDLRFADGQDYPAAVSAANVFISTERPLLDAGNGVLKSKANADAIALPVAILVNQKTVGAAEALAGILRSADRAMIIGTNTAGGASIDKEFPLKNGQRLRVATAEIKLGDGRTLPSHGLKPDIQVVVSLEDEKAYVADPFKEINKSSNLLAGLGNSGTNGAVATNRSSRRMNEADLIREKKEGKDLDLSSAPARIAEAEKPVVRDPVLGRALDLIKGIAALKQFRTS